MAELKLHLESQFAAIPGVTWETYGINGWEIDHRKPCNAFDLSDPAQQLAGFHYTNFNIIKCVFIFLYHEVVKVIHIAKFVI